MGIASLVLGIISVILALIPGCGLFLAPLPALIGLGLGIADWVGRGKRDQPKGIAVAGTVVSLIAFVVLIGWVGLIASQKPEGQTWQEFFEESSAGMEEFEAEMNKAIEEAEAAAEEAEAAAAEAAPEGGSN